MSKQVTAIVVCHESGDYLNNLLKALADQSRRADRVILVDTSESGVEGADVDSTLRLPSNTSFAEALKRASEELQESDHHFLWVLHDDSCPEVDCLRELLAAEEANSLAAVIGPKQVHYQQPRMILQQGLTLTPSGTPVSLVANELDQSQHDAMVDVMAVGTAGVLLRTDVYRSVGGFKPDVPPLAGDYDLCLRVRLSGHRVIVAPKARLRHAALALSGHRSKRWLGGGPKTAVRKAALHLRLSYSRLDLAILLWLFLPVITLMQVLLSLLQKRPNRIFSELSAGIWAFFTVAKRLAQRPRVRHSQVKAIRSAFDASWSQVRSINRSKYDTEDAATAKAAFERGDHELPAAQVGKSFTEDRGWLFVIALLGLSWNFFPTAVASVGGGSIPLAQNWWQVFTTAGASWQPIGQGFVAPSDPFNWALLTLSAFSPTVPSLAVSVLLFAAPGLAFVAAHRMATLLSPRTWVRNLVALGFALWPSLLDARSEARIPTVLALVLLPWFVFVIARAAGLGRSGSARSMRQTWSWVGVSGLLMALIGVSSPVLLVVILVALAIVAFTRIRRFGYLFWVPLPVAALFTPFVWHMVVASGQPLAVLADPGLPLQDRSGTVLQLLGNADWWALGYLLVPVLALFALLTRRWILAGVMVTFAALVLAIAQIFASVRFSNPVGKEALQWISGSPSGLLGAFGLISLAAMGLLLENTKPSLQKLLAGVVIITALAPMAYIAATAARSYEFRDDRVVPWLLSAESVSHPNLQMLIIQPTEAGFEAKWAPIGGVQLEDSNLAYRFALAGLNQNNAAYSNLAALVADLVSANGADLATSLSASHVAFVMVPTSSASASNDLANALDSVRELDSAGVTEFGRLWRVNVSVADAPAADKSPWSITKVVQLSVLLGFALLAIPTGAANRRAKVSQIFVESEGDA
ncbi:MAG: glycosyltransferase [Microbacteriaceae bacterium]